MPSRLLLEDLTVSLDGNLRPYMESARKRSLQLRRALRSVTRVHEMSRVSRCGKSWTTISKLILLNSVPDTFRMDSCWKRHKLVRMAALRWSTNVHRDTLRSRQFDNVQLLRLSTSWPTVARVRPTHSSSTILCLASVFSPFFVNCDASLILTWRSRVEEASKSERLRSFMRRRSQSFSRSCSDNSLGKKISSRGNFKTSSYKKQSDNESTYLIFHWFRQAFYIKWWLSA